MTQFQVFPKDVKESEAVQRAMFALGYVWVGQLIDNPLPLHKGAAAIYGNEDGSMQFDTWAGGEKESDYPIAKAEKIIAEAVKKLAAKAPAGLVISPEGWAREQLGLPFPIVPPPIIEEEEVPVRNPEFEAAVETLKAIGYAYHGGERWKPPLGVPKTFDVFWMVKGPSGPASVLHNSYDEAADEAKRLAEKEPGKQFVVLESSAAYCVEMPKPDLYLPSYPRPPF